MPTRSSTLVLIAFLATLAAYVTLALFDLQRGAPLDTLEAALLIEVGALAGVAVPSRTAPDGPR